MYDFKYNMSVQELISLVSLLACEEKLQESKNQFVTFIT